MRKDWFSLTFTGEEHIQKQILDNRNMEICMYIDDTIAAIATPLRHRGLVLFGSAARIVFLL